MANVVGLQPTQLDLIIVRGDDVSFTFTDNTVNIFKPGDTFIGTLRQNIDDNSPTAVTFTWDTSQLASGVVVASLTDTVTSAFIPTDSGIQAFPRVWDMERTRGGLKRTLFQGAVTVIGDYST